jgi:hypothetical protein
VHWRDPASDGLDAENEGRFVDQAVIPAAAAVHALAAAAGERVWWRELQVLVVAYSGLRCGEMAALTADRVDVARRRILVDRQVVEGRHGLVMAPPKNRRRRTTMYPARTPGGAELGALLARRLAEVQVPQMRGCADVVIPVEKDNCHASPTAGGRGAPGGPSPWTLTIGERRPEPIGHDVRDWLQHPINAAVAAKVELPTGTVQTAAPAATIATKEVSRTIETHRQAPDPPSR